MNLGPITIAMTIAIRPAIRTLDHYDRGVRQGGCDAFEPDRAGRLHEHHVAGPEHLGARRRARRLVRHPVVRAVAARQLADGEHVDPELGGELAMARW